MVREMKARTVALSTHAETIGARAIPNLATNVSSSADLEREDVRIECALL